MDPHSHDRVPVERYGLTRRTSIPLGRVYRQVPEWLKRDIEVPLSLIWTRQAIVIPHKVAEYQRLDPKSFTGDNVAWLTAWDDGTFETHSNHRTAATFARGEHWLRARIHFVLTHPGHRFIEGTYRYVD